MKKISSTTSSIIESKIERILANNQINYTPEVSSNYEYVKIGTLQFNDNEIDLSSPLYNDVNLKERLSAVENQQVDVETFDFDESQCVTVKIANISVGQNCYEIKSPALILDDSAGLNSNGLISLINTKIDRSESNKKDSDLQEQINELKNNSTGSSTNVGNFIDLSGRNLYLSGNLNIGDNNLIGTKNVSVGKNCFAGGKQFRVISANSQDNTITLDTVENLLTGMNCSLQIMENSENIGTILSINYNTKTVKVTNVPNYTRTDEHLNDPYLKDIGDSNYIDNKYALSAHYNPGSTYISNSSYNTFWIKNRPDIGTIETNIIGSFSYGISTSATQEAAHAEGKGTLAAAKQAHAEGRETSAFGYNSHAEGWATLAIGHDSHAEGNRTYAGNYQSHVEGYCVSCYAVQSHGEGLSNKIFESATCSHAEGRNVNLSAPYSFAWNGTTATYDIPKARQGTFNINPINGISGIYIGSKTLASYIKNNNENSINIANDNIKDIINTKNYSNGDEIDVSNTIHNDGFISKNDGLIKNTSGYSYTDKLELDRMSIYEMSGTYIYDVTACTVYDSSNKVIQKLGCTTTSNYNSKHQIQIRIVNKTISVYDKDYPENCKEYTFENASYVRFSSETNGFIVKKYNAKFLQKYATSESVANIESNITSLNSDVKSIRTDTNETKMWFQTLPIYEDRKIPEITGYFLSRHSKFSTMTGYSYTEAIPLKDSIITYSTKVDYDVVEYVLFLDTVEGDIFNESNLLLDEFGRKVKLPYVIKLGSSTGSGTVLTAKGTIVGNEIIRDNPSAKYIRFSGKKGTIDVTVTTPGNNHMLKFGMRNDVLFGKKLVVCGDSFSANNGTGITPYPEIIANRTGMHLTNISHGGDRMANVNDPGGNRVFSEMYTSPNIQEPLTNADYILFQYGLNEGVLPEQVGDKNSKTTNTLWGAWNTVLLNVITWNPGAKIGIIISDAWMNTGNCVNTYNALKQIAEWWGIPVLDLKEGSNSNPMIGKRTGVNPDIEKLRSKHFAIDYDNPIKQDSHPNQNGHNFRSTIIENFLRSL